MNPARLLPAVLMLWSCASSTPAPRAAPDLVPESWTTKRDTTPVLDRWWTSFEDTLAVHLVREALTNNHSVQIAAANVAASQAQARIAGAARLPQASAAGSGSRNKRSFIGFPIPGAAGQTQSTTSTSFSADVAVSWELDLWGRLRAGHAATIADLQAVEADWRAARLSLVAQTLRAYFGVVEAQRQVNLAEATVQSYDLSNRQVQSRYERGLRPTLDLLLSRASLSSAESVMHQRRLQLDVAVRQLEVLVGRYPAGRLRTSTRLPGVPSPIPAGLPAELIGRRPDLAAAQRRLAASDARVAEARRNLYPRIGLTASGGRSSEELGDLLDGDFGVWNLVGNLTQPLFQGGRLRAGIDLAEAHAERAVVGYAQAALRAFAEVESGLAAEGLLANQESALTAASRESTDARILAEQRYAKGLTDLLTLLTSQRASFDAESRLLAVQRQRLETRIDLHLALGGGFTLDAGTISATEETQ
ncbi:MAG TPA: TolC family protein [Candidatus Latescibacteria bacterium]|nr:transporter [Gemmatimonadaceae bacterium]MDP6016189.1 TolC family protein [Candidatus Latescibacterota bacterium]HJP29882.1 TolC family protein [Candidatus Latescibacterota bacterium]